LRFEKEKSSNKGKQKENGDVLRTFRKEMEWEKHKKPLELIGRA